MTIIGRSYADTPWYRTRLANIELRSGSSNTTISGMQFGSISLDVSLASLISNVTIRECKLSNLSLNPGSSGQIDNFIIEGNEISNFTALNSTGSISLTNNILNGSSLLDVNGNVNINISNNIFIVSNLLIFNQSNAPVTIFDSVIVTNGVNLGVLGSYSLNNCHIYNRNDVNATVNIAQRTTPAPQVENINNTTLSGDPRFNIPVTNTSATNFFDFGLQANSPLIGAGANGGDIGIAANYIFKYLGNPKGYPEVKITNYTGASSSNGTVTFDIEARSH